MLRRLLFILLIAPAAIGQQRIVSGTTRLTFDETSLRAAGLRLLSVTPTDTPPGPGISQFLIRGKSEAYVLTNGEVRGYLINAGGFILSSGARVLRINNFTIGQRVNELILFAGTLPVFRAAATITADTTSRTVRVPSTAMAVTNELAQAFGGVTAGAIAGTLAIEGSTAPADPATVPPAGTTPPGLAITPIITPGDLTFCELFDLRQVGRAGDRVALAAATTSWNIGNQKLDWWRRPDWRHPYIVLNLYRIRDDRFEQLGQSWVKHGFFALSESQCSTECTEVTNGTQLAPGCTDTYESGTNANQDTLGPRSEIDPWQGVWESQNAHGSNHPHGVLDHRLTVRDADFAPALNTGATYFLEGYYVHYQDTDVMNSAAWKPVTITAGMPGGVWRFGMSPNTTRPNIGFAIDAWTGAQRTIIAESGTPIKFQSNDGRGVLAAKAQDLRNGTWRYTYALLNVDINRQIGAFRVTIPSGATATDIGFAAPPHTETLNSPGGIAIDNASWSSNTTATAVTWTTTTNPLRWGTAYTFWFTTTAPPGTTSVAVTLFRDSMITISASTVGPH